MSKHTLFDELAGAYVAAGSSEAAPITRDRLLKLTGVTDSQLNYYIRQGAVKPPNGRTRAAKYSVDHVLQVRRVTHLLRRGDWTVQQIAESFDPSRRRTSASKQRSAGVDHETIYRVNDRIRIVVSDDLLDVDRIILKRLLKAGESTIKERRVRVLESIRATS